MKKPTKFDKKDRSYGRSFFTYYTETDEKLNNNMLISNFLKFAKQFEPDEKRQESYTDFFNNRAAGETSDVEAPKLRPGYPTYLTDDITSKSDLYIEVIPNRL